MPVHPHSSKPQAFVSSTGSGNRPSNHSAAIAGVNAASLHSITQDKKSAGPPFIYGGGYTGMNTVGNLSLVDT